MSCHISSARSVSRKVWVHQACPVLPWPSTPTKNKEIVLGAPGSGVSDWEIADIGGLAIGVGACTQHKTKYQY